MISESRHQSEATDGLPRPLVKKMRWPFPIIWIVPLAAAVLTAYFLWDKIQMRGPEITIQFSDGSNLKPGQTRVESRGVQVGLVSAVELTPDHKHVLVHVRLQRDQSWIASRGTLFWVVRPEVSLQEISGLGAILSGPYIQAEPGTGERAWQFDGLDTAPVVAGKGVHIILVADRVQNVQPQTPVDYRGIQVGAVEDIRLGDDSDHADIRVMIQDRYVPLIRSNSQFWTVSGADIHGGLLTGVKVKLDSLSSIISGQIEFATPEKDAGDPIEDDSRFLLHDTVDKDWLNWRPRIPLSPATESSIKPKEDKPETGLKQP